MADLAGKDDVADMTFHFEGRCYSTLDDVVRMMASAGLRIRSLTDRTIVGRHLQQGTDGPQPPTAAHRLSQASRANPPAARPVIDLFAGTGIVA